jgi:hypothetical protein
VIGYYVHHQGHGHLHRAQVVAAALACPVTGLSSLPRPRSWTGDWLQLPRDDSARHGYGAAHDITANGRLHWAPVSDAGLRGRMAAIARWLDRTAPRAFVVDQSVEVCVLARLHGVPVVGLTAPGRRTDAVHRLGFDICTDVVGAWPEGWTARLLPGVDPAVTLRVHAVGAVSRFPVVTRRPSARRRPRAVLLAGTGGDGFTRQSVADARAQTPGWDWTVLSRTLGRWHDDPAAVLARADVAVIHPGQNSLAEIAAARLPAVVMPATRPFDEQHVTADALRHRLPVVVTEDVTMRPWADLLEEALTLDGSGWAEWCDGLAAPRIAGVIEQAGASGAAA